jgi:hypothetical protein
LRGSLPFVQALHAAGINIRFLGLVRSYLVEEAEGERYWRFMFLLEMVTRTIKQQLRTKLRDLMKLLKKPGEQPYKVMYLLLILISTSEC